VTTATQPLPDSHRSAAARAAADLRTEAGLARLAFGVAALHVVDDNFLQPQPGTSAGDHLVGGLVQTALFVLAAWVYPRLRPGARATLALGFGLFTVVMGVGEAGYYTRETGPSGDDFTGLLAIPAGFLLIGIGLVTLWRSRRGGGLIRRYLRRTLLAVGLLLGAYRRLPGRRVVCRDPCRARVRSDPRAWRRVSRRCFSTSDGLRLEGWYVPSKNGAAVIVFPGRKGPQKAAGMLARHGYGVLLFDRRGEGESEGDPNGYGWASSRDVKAAISFLQSRPDVDDDRIGGLGLSVGGETLLQTAAETDDLNAVVSEGAGIRSVREAVDLPGWDSWITTAVIGLTTTATAAFTSDLPPRSLKDLSAEVSAPVFFIYATPGQGGESLTEAYYEAAKPPKELWAAEGGHTGAITAEPEEYERRVVGFFDGALLSGK
jgi:fermentation-respiration switch protein FrsA (DUF1100 family)